MVSNDLTPSELARYSRHLLLPEIGEAGQRRLKAGRVLCVGAGGLGSPALLYLAAAGVGTIGIVDFDVVDESNLQRQIIHGTESVGRPKLESARDRIAATNPEVLVETFDMRFSADNAQSLVEAFDVILDGTDNFPARYLVNDACVLYKRPNAFGSIHRFEGQAAVFAAPGGPCYRCLHPEPPPEGLVPSCAEAGVLGVLPGVIGTIQATEAIKLIVGVGEPLIGRFLIYDALKMRFRDLKLRQDPDCPVCGTRPSITSLREYATYCAPGVAEMTAGELRGRLGSSSAPFVLDVREPAELAEGSIPGSVMIPLGQLPQRLAELDASREIIVYCRSGARSGRAVALMRESGFSRVSNLADGILNWNKELGKNL